MKWGIVGAGLIGGKRALALSQLGETMVSVANHHENRAIALAEKYGLKYFTDYKSVTRDPDIDAVVVATSHNALSEITIDALQHGKHVLVEKPAGRNSDEVQAVVDAAKKSGRHVCVGFNHRFHPAIMEAYNICRSGKYGKLLYMRARYGHGGRIGYEKEWRFTPELSGGGQLIDQGSHLIDLSRFFSGEDLTLTYSMLKNYFWKSPAEDTGLLVLEGKEGKSATLFTSCVQWKNLFSFEIFFERAEVSVDGLGRSYGTETLSLYKMKPELGPPDIEILEFPGEDASFRAETADFIGKINGKPSLCATVEDALASISIIGAAYRRRKVAIK